MIGGRNRVFIADKINLMDITTTLLCVFNFDCTAQGCDEIAVQRSKDTCTSCAASGPIACVPTVHGELAHSVCGEQAHFVCGPQHAWHAGQLLVCCQWASSCVCGELALCACLHTATYRLYTAAYCYIHITYSLHLNFL